MKKLCLIIISCILLNTTKSIGCATYYPPYSEYSLLYFMPYLFLEGEIKTMARQGLYESMIKNTQSPYIMTEKAYAEHLDNQFLIGIGSDYFIDFYEEKLKKSNNLLALSHYAGSIFHASKSNDSIIYINDSIPASLELAVYNFSLMLEDPSMIYWVIKNIDFMLDYKTCEWKKVHQFCKNQDELDKVLSIESIRFSHLTASVLENFIALGGDVNSEYFKLLLIKSTLEFENKFRSHIKSKDFKNLYNYSKHLLVNEEDIYLDFLDFKKLLFKLNIKDKILLHILRGYSAFIGSDFNTAKKEYQYSRYLLNKSNKKENQKKKIAAQIDFLNIVIDSYSISDHEEYNNFIKTISNIIKNIPHTERRNSYYEVGQDAALKRFDLVTAYQFSTFNDFSSQQILEILMNKVDLHKTLDLVQSNNLLFPDRFPVNHKYIILETLALKFLRTDDFKSAINLLELLETDSTQLKFCQIPYYSNYDFYKWRTHDDTLPSFPNHDSLATRSWPYDRDCYSFHNCRYDEFVFEYKSQQTKHNKLTFIKEIKATKDSIESMGYGDKKSNLYYKLSEMYKKHFFNYNCIWNGSARYGTGSDYYFHFSLLGEDFLNKKMSSYMNAYSTISKSEDYLKKAIQSTRNKELLAKYNFKLLETYDKVENYWFTRKITTESIITEKQKKIKTLIDSIYTNTNYFNEVIKECAILYPQEKIESTINSNNNNDSSNIFNKTKSKDNNYGWKIILVLSIIILALIIRKKSRDKRI